jgi:Domain of unknown function (DUF4440)
MWIPARFKRAFLLGPLLVSGGCGSDAPVARDSTAASSAAPSPKSARSSPPGPSAGRSGDEAELTRLEREYAEALVRKDRAFLMRFYASDWRGGNWMGFWSKATMLKSVLNARYVVKSMNVRDLKVRVMGDVATVQGVDEEVTSMDGLDTSGKWAFTDVFERRNGEWVAVAGHTTEIAPNRR